MSIFVVDVATIALAFEAAGHIHADTILAHLRHQRTFINLLGHARHWIDDGSGSITAQGKIFSRSLFRTLFAVLAPSSTHGTTANHSSLRLHHGTSASVVGEVHVAKLLTHVDAFLSSR